MLVQNLQVKDKNGSKTAKIKKYGFKVEILTTKLKFLT